MCGIVGVVDLTGLSFAQQKFFRQGLYTDGLRGLHSTGVATLTKDFEPQVYKKALNASDFLQLSTTDKVLDKYGTKIMMLGHNRHATMGSLIDDNAHPFQHGNITMVHNGSLKNQWRLEDNAQFPVDSETITHNINKNGVDWTIPKLNGAFSLVWYDASNHTLNFIRNAERPMHYAVLNKSSFIFGSESLMLEWLADRNNLKIVDNEIKTLPIGNLMTLPLDAKELEFNHRIVELLEDTWGYGGARNYTPFQGKQETKKTEEKGKTEAAKGGKKEEEKGKESSVIYLPQDRDKSPRDLLAELHWNIGDTVEWICTGWSPNKSGRTGITTGYLQDDEIKGHDATWADVEIYSVHNMFDEGGLYSGQIVSAKEDRGATIVILNPRTIKMIDLDPYSQREDEAIIKTTEEYAEKHGDSPAFNSEEVAETELILGGTDTGTFYLGPRDAYIPRETWEKLTRYGCSQCSGNVSEEDHAEIVWFSETTFLCPECAEQLAEECGQTAH